MSRGIISWHTWAVSYFLVLMVLVGYIATLPDKVDPRIIRPDWTHDAIDVQCGIWTYHDDQQIVICNNGCRYVGTWRTTTPCTREPVALD